MRYCVYVLARMSNVSHAFLDSFVSLPCCQIADPQQEMPKLAVSFRRSPIVTAIVATVVTSVVAGVVETTAVVAPAAAPAEVTLQVSKMMETMR